MPDITEFTPWRIYSLTWLTNDDDVIIHIQCAPETNGSATTALASTVVFVAMANRTARQISRMRKTAVSLPITFLLVHHQVSLGFFSKKITRAAHAFDFATTFLWFSFARLVSICLPLLYLADWQRWLLALLISFNAIPTDALTIRSRTTEPCVYRYGNDVTRLPIVPTDRTNITAVLTHSH